MIRVLHSVSNMDRAGIETMLMNYYRHIDRDLVQFDFLVNKPKPGDYDAEVRELGGNIYLSPGLNPIHYPDYMKFVGGIIRDNPDIKIVHAHNEAMGLYALNGARRAGIETRIAHAHNTKIIRDYKWPLKIYCKQFLGHSATEIWGCGRDAGMYFFGQRDWQKRGMIMHNAIELDRFAYNEQTREKIRAQYGLQDKIVLGHVGRFNVQKNHTRLLEIFAEYTKIEQNAVLVLIGEGELEQNMKIKAKTLQIADKVIFAGLQSNVNEWYQAMDAFILPSLFEGLPVVGIEAQATGLPCIFSDMVTDEIVLSDTSIRISLRNTNRQWAESIKNLLLFRRDRTVGIQNVQQAGYDIEIEARRIQELYLAMSEGKR